jgi:hypothetical protein
MKTWVGPLAVWCVAMLAASGQDAAEREPPLKVVKFDELKKAIQAQKGKVVVLDLWAST